jgi:hypothetical protein
MPSIVAEPRALRDQIRALFRRLKDCARPAARPRVRKASNFLLYQPASCAAFGEPVLAAGAWYYASSHNFGLALRGAIQPELYNLSYNRRCKAATAQCQAAQQQQLSATQIEGYRRASHDALHRLAQLGVQILDPILIVVIRESRRRVSVTPPGQAEG